MNEIKDTKGKVLAIVDNFNSVQKGISFYGEKEDFIQVGAFRHDTGYEMKAHRHLLQHNPPIRKSQELLYVCKGSAKVSIYDEEDKFVTDVTISSGDYIISFWGGIGATILEDDTILIEPKTGPFVSDTIERIRI